MDKNKPAKKRFILGVIKGFTLIEILIIIVIVSILSGLGLASYNNFSEHKKLEEDAENIASVLRLAQSKTIAADESPKTLCTTYTEFIGYQVNVYHYYYELIFICKNTPPIEHKILNTYEMNENSRADLEQTYRFTKLTGAPPTGLWIRENIIHNSDEEFFICMEPTGAVNVYKDGCP